MGLRKIAVLLHEVTAGKLPLIVLPASCIISCVKPYYFPSAFRSAFLRSGIDNIPSPGEGILSMVPVSCENRAPKF